MSSAAAQRGFGVRALQAFALALLFAIFYGTVKMTGQSSGAVGTVAALGFLLMGGTLASELVEPLRVPHLTGYLATGIIAGPHVLHLIDEDTVASLSEVNGLALALIAFAGGAELRIDVVKKTLRSLAISTVVQHAVVGILMGGVFLAAAPLIPFLDGIPTSAAIAAGMLWGVIAMTRSPAATLGVLAQTRAQGPLATFTLAFVMTSDVVVIILVATAITIARMLIDPSVSFSWQELEKLGTEILGSISLGTTLGLLIIAYMKWVGRQLLIVLVALGFGVTEMIKYLGFEPLLTFLCAGFLVQNLSKQGDKFLHTVEDTGSVVYVLFFATAGADINIPLLGQMWKVALILFAGRLVTTVMANAIGTRLAKDPPTLRTWGWSGLISQAGVALGVSQIVSNAFPQFAGFRALAFACVALNEMFGPIVFKLAIDQAGETSHEPERSRSVDAAGHGHA